MASLTSVSGPSLERFFGSWSVRYHRFTTNLSTPRVRVELDPDRDRGQGIDCILHWIDSRAVLSTGPGSVCAGDGWPLELWRYFMSVVGDLPPGTVAAKLWSFAFDSSLSSGNPVVDAWRAVIRDGDVSRAHEVPAFDHAWLPVPAVLVGASGVDRCIFSWAPGASRFSSVGEALASPQARSWGVDLEHQAVYYLECTLARLHGVRFGPNDWIEDREFARRAEVKALDETMQRLEEARIKNPELGRLDALGPISAFLP